jgi:hypothetical protein
MDSNAAESFSAALAHLGTALDAVRKIEYAQLTSKDRRFGNPPPVS